MREVSLDFFVEKSPCSLFDKYFWAYYRFLRFCSPACAMTDFPLLTLPNPYPPLGTPAFLTLTTPGPFSLLPSPPFPSHFPHFWAHHPLLPPLSPSLPCSPFPSAFFSSSPPYPAPFLSHLVHSFISLPLTHLPPLRFPLSIPTRLKDLFSPSLFWL